MAERGKLSKAWGRYTGDPFKASPRRRFRVDLAVEDSELCDYIEGAEWWIARSARSTSQIQRMFDRGDVAICLIERTGAIIELGLLPTMRQYLIAIQLVRSGRDWDLDVTLEELGVYLEEIWDGASEVDPENYDSMEIEQCR